MSLLSLNFSISAADKAAILTSINDIKTKMPFLINLTPQERQRLRKKGTKRTGYVNDVFQGVSNNPTVVPATFDVNAYLTDKVASDDLTEIVDQLSPVFEGMGDTLLLLGVELMKQSDSGYDYLKRAAKDNAAVQAIVDQVAKAFQRSGEKENPANYLKRLLRMRKSAASKLKLRFFYLVEFIEFVIHWKETISP